MKRVYPFIGIVFLYYFSNAQVPDDSLRNYNWILGYGDPGNPTIYHTIFDFHADTLRLYSQIEPSSLFMYYTNASICDTAGNLLFFSNGCGVMDSSFEYVPGAERINHGPLQDYFCDQLDGGGYANSLLVLPDWQGKKYNLIHTLPSSHPEFLIATNRLLWSKIVEVDDGALSATQIDSTLIDTLLFTSGLAACRHANGRDWWVVASGHNSNIYHIVKIGGDSAQVHRDTIGIPTIYDEDGSGESVFSPDGSRYARYTIFSDLQVFDFDRCTGHFSHPVHVPIVDAADTVWAAGAAFSPSGRYLYAASSSYIYQFDTWASDLAASKTTVAVMDSFLVNGLPTGFYQCELAPDGRIYVSCPGGKRTFHVIEHPDSTGIACHVIQHKYLLQWAITGGLPHFPNFRLGALPDSLCGQVSEVKQPVMLEAGLKVWPNPASKLLHIETNVVEGTCQISDLYGRVVQKLNINASQLEVEVSKWPPGTYLLSIRPSKGGLIAKKFVLVH
ncbi:MAG: T9SS type A sorting domain-containing protein [Phycisphaerae bacterium]|nr:T9SS type A sorting domain-containing protein [Saprospiraceae bacterium]